MSAATKAGQDIYRALAIGCVLILLLAAALWWVFSATSGTKLTAYFHGAVGVYPGGTVRMLGVEVGSIDTVEPGPANVKVTMTVDEGIAVPANPTAVVVLPSVVSDRYIQLPSYTGGPRLSSARSAVIPVERTRTPTEIDDAYRTLDKLATTLGPSGANRNGAVNDLLNTGAANLAGSGQTIKDTLDRLGKLSTTLNDNRQDLFGTVQNLARFTTTLQQSDAQVRDFSSRVSDVAGFLDSERGNLATAVRELGAALAKVKEFVQQNRGILKSNVDNLTRVTKTLADQRAPLAETLDTAPLALGNLVNAYNASSGSLDSRPSIQELTDPPLVLLCKAIKNFDHSPGPQILGDACSKIADLVQGVIPLPSLTQVLSSLYQGKLPALPAKDLSTLSSSTGGGR